MADWLGTAGFDRIRRRGFMAMKWAGAYVDFAAGEVSGFGGGGVHGYRALEGTFVGGCLFSGRQVGRS